MIPISNAPVYSFDGVTQGGPPPVPDTAQGILNSQSSVPVSNIDPVLRGSAPEPAGSTSHPKRNSGRTSLEDGTSSESESTSEDNSRSDRAGSGFSDDDGDDMPDVGWAATGQARTVHPGMYLSGSEYLLTLFQDFVQRTYDLLTSIVLSPLNMNFNTHVTRTIKRLRTR